jgi:hypothetical protein
LRYAVERFIEFFNICRCDVKLLKPVEALQAVPIERKSRSNANRNNCFDTLEDGEADLLREWISIAESQGYQI